jgi:hypothetical protein
MTKRKGIIWDDTGKRGIDMNKSFVNRIWAFVLSLAIFSSVFAFNPTEAKAATNLELNQTYNLTVSGNEHDTLTFQTPGTGYFYVNILVTDVKNGQGESIYGNFMRAVMDLDGQTLMYELVGKSNGMQTSKAYSYAPSHTATISVSADTTMNWTYYYQITVVNVTPKNFETEDNNSAKKADAIKLKQTYNGILNKKYDDEDWFVFKAPNTGSYKFYVQNTDDARTGDFFYATGYKSKHTVDRKNFSYTSFHAGKGWKSSKKIKLKKGAKYYIRITDPLYESIPYRIKVKKA